MKLAPRQPHSEANGTKVTTQHLHDLLPRVFNRIGLLYNQRGDQIIKSWPEVIGPQFARMTRAIAFNDGVLTVKVSNSSLYSLLSQQEKPRLLGLLRKKFPQIEIKTISFRVG